MLLAVLLTVTATAAAAVKKGEIEGSKYMIATPEKWQGKLLLIAHGYRMEGQPLDGDYDIRDRFGEELLAKGWAIASTSFRRNGWIVEDAITDLKVMRDLVEKEEGKVERCILVGSSMGGLIGTLIAEGAMDRVDGVVAIGAYLGPEEGEGFYKTLLRKPKVPVLYLTTETELDHPRNYRKEAGADKTALWEVKRPGHCNVSDAERLDAVLAVNGWIEGSGIAKEKDATVAPPVLASTAQKVDGALVGKITAVSESWGNLSTDLVAADLETLGLKPGDKAILKGVKELEVIVARDWSEAEKGQGVIFAKPTGRLGIAINSGRASEALGVKNGDAIRLAAKK